MAQLDSYITRKAAVLAQRRSDFSANPAAAVVELQAASKVAGITGARPTKMGETVLISDSAPALAGHALGPTAPEMLLGALASCLVHTYLIQAALLELPIDHVEVVARGKLDMSGVVGLPYEQPPRMQDIHYTAQIAAALSAQDLERLHAQVEATCPVLNTLRLAMDVPRSLES